MVQVSRTETREEKDEYNAFIHVVHKSWQCTYAPEGINCELQSYDCVHISEGGRKGRRSVLGER